MSRVEERNTEYDKLTEKIDKQENETEQDINLYSVGNFFLCREKFKDSSRKNGKIHGMFLSELVT